MYRIFLIFTLCASYAFAQNKMLMASAKSNNDEMRAKSIDVVAKTNNQSAEAEKMKNNEFCRSLYKVATEFPQDFVYLKGEKKHYGEWESKVVNSLMSDICITANNGNEYSWQGIIDTQSDWQKANISFQKITQTLRSCAVLKDFKPEENVSMTQNVELKNKEGSNILRTWTVVEPIETPYLGMQIASELKFKEGKWGVMVSIKKVKTF